MYYYCTMFQEIFRSLCKCIQNVYGCAETISKDLVVFDHIGKLPNEILTQILEYLPMEEKLRAVLVCKKWKSQVDQNVSFKVYLSDKNFNQVGRIYQARRVRSLKISNYSYPTIPIEELSHLRNLELANYVNEQAIHDLFSRATMLNSLEVKVHRRPENESKPPLSENAVFPALLSLKRLIVGYEPDCLWNSQTNLVARSQAWNKILDDNMPNLETITINLFEGLAIPPITGSGFFCLISSKPKLQRFLLYQIPREKVKLDQVSLTPTICEGLQRITKLTHVRAIVLEKDEFAWNLLLSGQTCLESLALSCEWGISSPTQGFSMSMVLPVLRRCTESLHTIELVIDTQRNGSVLNMKMFSEIKSLRLIYLKRRMKEHDLRKHNVANCNTIITPVLRYLYITGFEVFEEDANNVIKKIAKLDLVKVELKQGRQSTWINFEERVRELGMDKEVNVIGSVSVSNPEPISCSWHHVEFVFKPRLA